MSQENVDRVRHLLDLFRGRDSSTGVGFSERDLVAAGEIMHPEMVLDSTRAPIADIRGTYRGWAEMTEFWRRWLEAWDTIEFEDELTDAGDHVLAAITRQAMRGKGSGIVVEFPPYWMVFTVREGKVVRQVFYLDGAEAREVAGLAGSAVASQPRQGLIVRWLAAGDAGDLDAFDELLQPDVVVHAPLGLSTSSREDEKRVWTDALAAMPDINHDVQEVLAEGDVEMARVVVTGTLAASFGGVEGTGESFRIDQAVIAHLRDGKIAEAWEIADIAALRAQVGG